jgi:hypothetical protein
MAMPARLPFAAINQELILELALTSCAIDIIRKRRTAIVDRRL